MGMPRLWSRSSSQALMPSHLLWLGQKVCRAAFLGYDAIGALLWSSLYAGLGYFFADSLDSVAAFLSRFSSALALGIGVPLILLC